MTTTVQYVVGNTYNRLDDLQAEFDRSGKYKKVHDWTLFVDVVNGDQEQIEQVNFRLGETFEPTKFTCSCPIPIARPNGTPAWRFSTRQQTYGPIVALVTLRGAGGSEAVVKHRIVLQEDRKKPVLKTFHDRDIQQKHRMNRLPENQKFGIELELTSDAGVDVAGSLSIAEPVDVSGYREGRITSDRWKIMPDSSITCNRNQPNCKTFELVSPVLRGGSGLDRVSRILNEAGKIKPRLKVNKSMGFHVHVDVSQLNLSQLIKVCQNFIKYEDAMNELMPQSRRDSSPECERFFKSNRDCVEGSSNKQKHKALAACHDIESLAQCMNPSGRYYKLNLQNLATGRQPTIEFRQHSATVDYRKVGPWVRFCVAFVTNSARLAAPSPFKDSRTINEKFGALFLYVIKDRALRDYFRGRQEELAIAPHLSLESACCPGCASGSPCASQHPSNKF